jgi:hypothetical protein
MPVLVIAGSGWAQKPVAAGRLVDIFDESSRVNK